MDIKFPFKNKYGYRETLITIWHKDPGKYGSDDSCGWFMRSYHGDKEMLKKIKSSIEFSFDSTYKSDSTLYHTGYFLPENGMPNMSVHGIALNMFKCASWEFFNHNRKKQNKWMKNNLYDILNFAENPIDSLRDDILGTFRIGCGSPYNREESLNHYATVIYGWLLRENRKWYRHPRWHIHHWSISFYFMKNFFKKIDRILTKNQ